MVIAQVTRARSHTDDVEWSAEDGTRTELDFLCRCVEAAINAGATTINIPDTVGYTTPEEYFNLFKMVRERVPNADKAVFSTHCHNDLGMAVANSLAGCHGRRAADRMHHQRHRRAGRQRRARRGRDGDPDPQRQVSVRHRHRRHDADARVKARRRPRPRSRCNTTRPSSAGTRSRMRAASIRTACSRMRRPTRSCGPKASA